MSVKTKHLGRLAGAGHGLEDVARAGQGDAFADVERGLPLAGGSMQHETAVGLHRAAEIHRLRGEALGLETVIINLSP